MRTMISRLWQWVLRLVLWFLSRVPGTRQFRSRKLIERWMADLTGGLARLARESKKPGAQGVWLSRLQGTYRNPLKRDRAIYEKLWLGLMGEPMSRRQYIKLRKALRSGVIAGSSRTVLIHGRTAVRPTQTALFLERLSDANREVEEELRDAAQAA
jgi:hypothetical protein